MRLHRVFDGRCADCGKQFSKRKPVPKEFCPGKPEKKTKR